MRRIRPRGHEAARRRKATAPIPGDLKSRSRAHGRHQFLLGAILILRDGFRQPLAVHGRSPGVEQHGPAFVLAGDLLMGHDPARPIGEVHDPKVPVILVPFRDLDLGRGHEAEDLWRQLVLPTHLPPHGFFLLNDLHHCGLGSNLDRCKSFVSSFPSIFVFISGPELACFSSFRESPSRHRREGGQQKLKNIRLQLCMLAHALSETLRAPIVPPAPHRIPRFPGCGTLGVVKSHARFHCFEYRNSLVVLLGTKNVGSQSVCIPQSTDRGLAQGAIFQVGMLKEPNDCGC